LNQHVRSRREYKLSNHDFCKKPMFINLYNECPNNHNLKMFRLFSSWEHVIYFHF
jgi:hypothetical protein